MTKICVFGAGAIGGYIGARLAHKAESEVSLVARGPHLAAMEANGLILKQGGETFTVHPRVSSDPKTLGPQDYVIVTVKAHALPGVLDQLQPLLQQGHRSSLCPEWFALVVFLRARRPL